MDKKFIINLQGKDFIKFEGLLNEFHQNEGGSIETIELENSTIENPKFKAIVKGKKGTYTGHGDADETNVNSMILRHRYRMAETRAIARALRWYNNIGMCSSDEMGGSDTNSNTKEEVSKPISENQLKEIYGKAEKLKLDENKLTEMSKYGGANIPEELTDIGAIKIIKALDLKLTTK